MTGGEWREHACAGWRRSPMNKFLKGAGVSMRMLAGGGVLGSSAAS